MQDTNQITWPTSLSDDFKSQLLKLGTKKTLYANQHIVLQELASSGVSYFINGTVVVTMQTPFAKTINNMVFSCSDWFGDYLPDEESNLSFKFSVLDVVEIIHFDNQKLRALLDEYTETYQWLYYISVESRPKWLQSQLLSSENKDIRVVYLLLELAIHEIKPNMPRILSISQQMLSEMIGISRQRVNEVLVALQSKNLVKLERNAIEFIDFDGLLKLLDDVDLSFRNPQSFLKY